MESNDLERLNRDARDAWNQNASFLEERTGEGNDWRLNFSPCRRQYGCCRHDRASASATQCE